MDSDVGAGPAHPVIPEVTPQLLADLQAGLLDDLTAARVRRVVRTDTQAARTLADLNAVRRHLSELGAEATTAPQVPAPVVARVVAALRNASGRRAEQPR
ncbi:hypothetical protein [Mycobacterium sp. SMC-4]|uniref:hypothetical protein n=1 Tax=Mycobacterium sp. SMC-4 TaxID=2857059 RepID=UPI0021B41283|nr:hypothetical protein [Mycobacterium sp. SMC-4]UXA18152.1 hypothetical protein KXD98_26500 [Mycobacterium sp. SMC-4]